MYVRIVSWITDGVYKNIEYRICIEDTSFNSEQFNSERLILPMIKIPVHILIGSLVHCTDVLVHDLY